MSKFEPAIEKLLALKGGLVDALGDPGGITNFGISLRFLHSINSQATADDIRALTQEKAVALYREYFWERGDIGKIDDQALANKLLELAVEVGVRNAIRILQVAAELGDCTRILGPYTVSVVNNWDPHTLLQSLRLAAVQYFHDLARAQPSQRGFLMDQIGKCLV